MIGPIYMDSIISKFPKSIIRNLGSNFSMMQFKIFMYAAAANFSESNAKMLII
jgi:hypothetical protein